MFEAFRSLVAIMSHIEKWEFLFLKHVGTLRKNHIMPLGNLDIAYLSLCIYKSTEKITT